MDFYKGKNQNKGALLRDPQGKLSVMSPVTGENISLTEIRIPSDQVMESIYKHRSNKRSIKLLNKLSVCDILPEIAHDKRNTKPVIAVKDSNGKFEIIEGLRRSYAVSLVPDAELVLHYASAMTEEEKKLLAKRADTYKAPSLIDLGQSLLEYETEMGHSFSVRLAAEEFGISVSRVSVALRTAKIQSDFYQIFPDVSYLNSQFMSEIVATDPVVIEQAIAKFGQFNVLDVDFGRDDVLDDVKELSLQTQKSVLEFVRLTTKNIKKMNRPAKTVKATEWDSDNLPTGVQATVSSKNVKLTISQEYFNSEQGKAVKALLLGLHSG